MEKTIQPREQGRWKIVSALFQDAHRLQELLSHLLQKGIARDLIEVAVPEKVAQKYFPGVQGRFYSPLTSSAAKGALGGLLLFSIASLILIFSGRGSKGGEVITFIMLLGPNMGVIAGALCGLIVGFFLSKEVPSYLQQGKERGEVLCVVKTKEEKEVHEIEKLLKEFGGTTLPVEEL